MDKHNTLHGLYYALGLDDRDIAQEVGIDLERFRAIEAGKENATIEEVDRLTKALCPGQYEYLTYLRFQKF